MKPLLNRIYTLAERVIFVQRGRVQGYLLATCVVAFALWLRLFIAPAESGLPFLTFFPAVTLVALLGGVGAGLYALILCCFLASYLFIPPFQALNFAFTKELIFTNLVFACEEFLVILVIEALYRQRSRSLITTQQLNDVSLIKQELDILAAAFDGDDGVIITDAHGHIQRVNRAFTEATGYSADEIKGHTPQILQSGDHDAQFYRAMWDTIRREGAWRGETWSRRKDGTSIPNWLTITAIKNSDGQLTHYVGTQVDISQRLSIEAQLLASEKRYRTLFESAVDAIFIAHPHSGLILDCNTSACQLMQKPKNQLVGMHQTKLHPADQAEHYQRVFQEHIKTGREIVEDVFVVLENGAAIPVDIHAVVIELEGEAVILGLFRNITQRKLLEDQLAATAAEFEALYDNAPCGYHSIDANGYFTRINKLALAWFECERHEIIGKLRPVDFFTPASKVLFEQSFPRFRREGKIDNLEFELVGKAGTTRQIILNAVSVLDANGAYLESRSVMFDISEQKRMKEVLERVSAEQHAMLETDLVAIVKIKNHQIIWHNKALSRIFGYDANELAGARTRIFYPNEAAYLELSAEVYPILHQQHSYRNQIEMIRKDGARIWVDMHGVSLNEADDTSLWILSDISTLKKYQQRLEDLAFHDALTGLPNRTLLTDRITQALSHARRLKQLLAVCFIDLDGFKPVNDIHGHEAGDLLLQTIAKRMLAMVRAHDTVARVGGDEFVILLTQLEVETDYQNVLTRMVTQINQPILLADGCEVKVGASVGVAVYPSHSTDADLLLRYADEAMYDAKHHGKNRVVLYQAS